MDELISFVISCFDMLAAASVEWAFAVEHADEALCVIAEEVGRPRGVAALA